jgi:hypothetical protein
MEKITPSKTNKNVMKPCGKTDCAHCVDNTVLQKDTVAENKDALAANIFRKYYETLLQGYSFDFRQAYNNHGNFHCT